MVQNNNRPPVVQEAEPLLDHLIDGVNDQELEEDEYNFRKGRLTELQVKAMKLLFDGDFHSKYLKIMLLDTFITYLYIASQIIWIHS